METSKEKYLRLQKDSGFEIGNTVKIVGIAKTYQFGWNDAWTYSMTETYGKTFVIYDINVSGIKLENSNGYNYPFFCLQLLNEGEEDRINIKDALNSGGSKI